ncbi:MAG: hypothetical protein ACTHYV_01355, partial [Psychroflexus sp.]
MFNQKNLFKTLLFSGLIVVVSSCSSYSNASAYDGIYQDENAQTSERNLATQTQNESQRKQTNQGEYTDYFKKQGDMISEARSQNEVFTDIDSYSSQNQQTLNAQNQASDYTYQGSEYIDYNASQSGWGNNPSQVTINIHQNNPWFYSGWWNAPYYGSYYGGYYNPWRYGYYGLHYNGFYSPHYGGFYGPSFGWYGGYYAGWYNYRNPYSYYPYRRSNYANSYRGYNSNQSIRSNRNLRNSRSNISRSESNQRRASSIRSNRNAQRSNVSARSSRVANPRNISARTR